MSEKKAPPYSEAEIAIARDLRAKGRTWWEVDVALKRGKGSTLKFFHRRGWHNVGIDHRGKTQAARERLAEERNERAGERLVAGGGRYVEYVDPYAQMVPPAVAAERDRAFARPLNLNAQVFGDPLPGRSALDRRTLEISVSQ